MMSGVVPTIRVLSVAVLLWSGLSACAAETLIYAAKLIDGRAAQPVSDVTLVVAEGKISRIISGFATPQSGDRVIDLRKYTVVPGLMDMHTHLMSQHSKKSSSWRIRSTRCGPRCMPD